MFTHIIDRYIARRFFFYFLAGLIIFPSLFIVIDLSGKMAKLDNSTVAIQYYTYFFFELLHQMLPMACLIGTVFTLSDLNRNSELLALLSSGMSLVRVSGPILILVALISILGFWFQDQILPPFIKKKNYLYYVEIKKKPWLYSTVKTNKIWYRSKNILFNIKSLQPEKNRAQGITLYYLSPTWDLLQIIRAHQVEFNDYQWQLEKGTVTTFSKVTGNPSVQKFTSKSIDMGGEAANLQAASQTSSILSFRELRQFIQKNKSSGMETSHYEVDYHAKFSFAFAALIMSLIGISFAVSRARAPGFARNITLCLITVFLYWSLYSSGINLGHHGGVSPVLAAWTPNFIFFLLSIFFLLRLRK